jgi:hypothetical protein
MLARTRSNRLRVGRQSHVFAERRRRRAIIGWVALVVALGTWTFSLSRLSYLEFMQVASVDTYGDELLAMPMRAATLDALDGSYLGLFSRANIFLYSKTAIAHAIASTSPRIDNVAVRRNGLRGLSVTVSEKAPEAVICAELPDVSDTDIPLSKDCYLADTDAYLYKLADDPDAANYMRYYLPALPDTNVLGTQATSTTEFKRLETLVGSVEKAGIRIHAMLVQGDGSYELYADNPDGDSIVVIQMNERANLTVERDNLVAFWNHMVSDAHAAGKKIAWSEIKTQFPPNVYSRAADIPSK